MATVAEALERLSRSRFRSGFHLSRKDIARDRGKLFTSRRCCCRGCFEKWYHVPQHRALTEEEQEAVVKLLMAWIGRNQSEVGHEKIR